VSGSIRGPEEITAPLLGFLPPRHASLDPVPAGFKDLRMWFVGYGYLRLQVKMERRWITWSGLQMTEERAREQSEERHEGFLRMMKECGRQEREKKEKEARIEIEARKKKTEVLRRKREKWMAKHEDGDMDSEDMPEELTSEEEETDEEEAVDEEIGY
jgi:hypothetical protein